MKSINGEDEITLVFIAFAFGCNIGCEYLMKLIKTPDEVFADSKLYLDIYVWSLPFVFFYNIATGIFSAMGDSRTPFLFLAFSSTSNIVLDIVFVNTFGMGVDGVAWATFLCQGVSCILALSVVFFRLRDVKTEAKVPFFSFDVFKKFVKIAVPSILRQ